MRDARASPQLQAFAALAQVVSAAGGGGWPETMQRELQACRSPQERQAWAEKWGEYLSGQAQREERGKAVRPSGPTRQPS
jgi:hypothetical protein